MKVSIVAIGTEITAGEVVNSNAAWLSTELELLGFEVTHHLAVPDDKVLMLDAFDFLKTKTDLIVTTGGLGPTTDDFTADVVAQWLGKEFQFNEEVWSDLQRLLADRGLTIRGAHKTQCWFPEDARIFGNPVGSARGFYSESADKKVLVLPGPPREIQGMWEQSVAEFLNQMPKAEKKLLKKWTCLGIPESELAEITETLFKDSGLVLGYRASVPYVQLKVWFDSETQFNEWRPKVEEAIAEWLVTVDGKDAILNLIEKLPLGEVHIYDSFSEGYLNSRLWESGLSENFHMITTSLLDRGLPAGGKTILFLEKNATGVEVEAGVLTDDHSEAEKIVFPYKIPLNSKRAQKYFVEMAFQIWARMLG